MCTARFLTDGGGSFTATPPPHFHAPAKDSIPSGRHPPKDGTPAKDGTPSMWTEWQTGVKTLPSCNFVYGR